MKRFLLLIITLFVVPTELFAQNDSLPRVKFFYGGRIDVVSYYDSRATLDARNGVQYIMPAPADYNSAGEDLNAMGRVRFSIAPTRVFGGVDISNVLKAKGRAYIEIDFMGNGETFINIPRIRHAYFSLDWARQSLLIGQTSHLSTVDEASANTVTFGGGYPFNPLCRPIQFRFTQRLGKAGHFALALAMFSGNTGTEQSYALMPDVHARFVFGNPSGLSAGVVGGVSFLRPRTITAESTIAHKNYMAWDASAFIKYAFSGHCVTISTMIGTNLRRYEMMGGYAPLLSDVQNGVTDYGYDGITTVSAWLDYNSKSYKGWQFGLFAGLQRNLGSAQPIDVSLATVSPAKNISFFWSLQPRVTYTYKSILTFGLEYTLSQAQWGKTMNDHYQPSQLLPNTSNNRITLLARFKF